MNIENEILSKKRYHSSDRERSRDTVDGLTPKEKNSANLSLKVLTSVYLAASSTIFWMHMARNI